MCKPITLSSSNAEKVLNRGLEKITQECGNYTLAKCEEMVTLSNGRRVAPWTDTVRTAYKAAFVKFVQSNVTPVAYAGVFWVSAMVAVLFKFTLVAAVLLSASYLSFQETRFRFSPWGKKFREQECLRRIDLLNPNPAQPNRI